MKGAVEIFGTYIESRYGRTNVWFGYQGIMLAALSRYCMLIFSCCFSDSLHYVAVLCALLAIFTSNAIPLGWEGTGRGHYLPPTEKGARFAEAVKLCRSCIFQQSPQKGPSSS